MTTRPSRLPRSRRGFTLVELLLVLVILGTLAALVLPKFTGRTEQARITAAQTQIATFGTALDAYEVDTGSYPSGSGGLQSLVSAPSDVQGWRGPYLKSDIPGRPVGPALPLRVPRQVQSERLRSALVRAGRPDQHCG
jgi:general secretion pathway protein G